MNNCEGIGRRIEGIFSHKSELAEIAAGISVCLNFAETGARVDHIYFEFNIQLLREVSQSHDVKIHGKI